MSDNQNDRDSSRLNRSNNRDDPPLASTSNAYRGSSTIETLALATYTSNTNQSDNRGIVGSNYATTGSGSTDTLDHIYDAYLDNPTGDMGSNGSTNRDTTSSGESIPVIFDPSPQSWDASAGGSGNKNQTDPRPFIDTCDDAHDVAIEITIKIGYSSQYSRQQRLKYAANRAARGRGRGQ